MVLDLHWGGAGSSKGVRVYDAAASGLGFGDPRLVDFDRAFAPRESHCRPLRSPALQAQVRTSSPRRPASSRACRLRASVGCGDGGREQAAVNVFTTPLRRPAVMRHAAARGEEVQVMSEIDGIAMKPIA